MKKKLRVPRSRQTHRTLLTDLRTLEVAHAAAGISESVHDGPDHLLAQLREKMSGFPGVWSLCARAALALQAALDEAGDPQCVKHDFIECVDNFADILLGENADWNDNNVLTEKARFVVERNQHEEVNT
jgi:hypothetical protein